jgi:hypothetical protein
MAKAMVRDTCFSYIPVALQTKKATLVFPQNAFIVPE